MEIETTYHAKPEKIIKDYILNIIDGEKGIYQIDEEDGIKIKLLSIWPQTLQHIFGR